MKEAVERQRKLLKKRQSGKLMLYFCHVNRIAVVAYLFWLAVGICTSYNKGLFLALFFFQLVLEVNSKILLYYLLLLKPYALL